MLGYIESGYRVYSYVTSYWFWLGLLLIGFIVLWLIWGGREHEMIGITPLCKHPDLPIAHPQVSIPVRPKPRINMVDAPKSSRGESICRQTIEEVYGVRFDRVRPNWLRNTETGYNLELDCYNSDLKLAVEYNGVQHYEWPNFTGQTKDEFVQQIRRDRFKYDKCEALGVYLITVPYTVPFDQIKPFILTRLPR